MRFFFLNLLALCWTVPAHAFDLTTQSLVRTTYVTSKVTSTPFDHKLIHAAREDAALFVASDGQLRGVRLQAALHYLQRNQPQLTASDLELAQAILVQ